MSSQRRPSIEDPRLDRGLRHPGSKDCRDVTALLGRKGLRRRHATHSHYPARPLQPWRGPWAWYGVMRLQDLRHSNLSERARATAFPASRLRAFPLREEERMSWPRELSRKVVFLVWALETLVQSSRERTREGRTGLPEQDCRRVNEQGQAHLSGWELHARAALKNL